MINDVLQSDEIFTNVTKGQLASAAQKKAAFGDMKKEKILVHVHNSLHLTKDTLAQTE